MRSFGGSCGFPPNELITGEMIVGRERPILLICDDDETFQLGMRHFLRNNYDVRTARNTDEAKIIIKKNPVSVLLLDIEMRTPREGLDALPSLRELDEDMMIVVASGHTDSSLVRQAIELGAEDFISKGSDPEEILLAFERVLKNRERSRTNQRQIQELKQTHGAYRLVGSSQSMENLRKLIAKVQSKPVNIVIFGETGTGKEVVARQLRWTLADKSLCPFVSIDSSTITGELAESILFGHEKGAFTGADRARKGVFEEANGGVLFFDEIGNMSLDIQSKLLRVIQEKEVTRVGSVKTMPLDFRVVCATNKRLEDLIKIGLFKEDLYQRLNVVPLFIPPLRDRKEDIPELVEYFVEKAKDGRSFTDEALSCLQAYDWPGNIRELQNVVSYVVALSDEPEIDVADLPPLVREGAFKRPTSGTAVPSASATSQKESYPPRTFYEEVEGFEKKLLAERYAEVGGNISQLALSLGMDRSHLYKKLKQYGIHLGTLKSKTSF